MHSGISPELPTKGKEYVCMSVCSTKKAGEKTSESASGTTKSSKSLLLASPKQLRNRYQPPIPNAPPPPFVGHMV